MEHAYKIEDLKAKTGSLVSRVNGYLLHSKYNPVIEAQKCAKCNYTKHHTHIVFGYGNGYLVDALSELLTCGEKIIIIDPLIELGVISIDDRHKREPLYYWEPKDTNTLAYCISQLTTVKESKVKIICSFNYDKLFPNELKTTLQMIKNYQEKSIINENTIVFLAQKWQDNLSENTISIVNDFSLKEIYSKFSKPVVIASGGPSLTKQLPLLKKIRENVLVIAAGSTINSLLAVEIEPDFVVSIDGSEVNYTHFKDFKFNNARLIYSPFSYPEIRSSFEKKAFVFTTISENQTGEYFTRKFNHQLPSLVGGASVAHYALTIGQYISTGPIAIIGQDLAFTDNKTHASNNKQEKEITEKDIAIGNIMEVDGYYGDKVLTSKVLFSMKTTFEEMARFYPSKVPIFNCTEGGVKINGYEQITFQQFYENYESTKTLEDDFSVENLFKKSIEKNTFITAFENEITFYDKILINLSEALSILKKNNSRVAFNNKVIKSLEKIDRNLSRLFPNVQMQFVLEPIALKSRQDFLEKENETAIETYQRVYSQSKALYESLLEVTKKSKKNIEKLIKELKIKENQL